MNGDNVIELRDRKLVREHLVREPSAWGRLRYFAAELAQRIFGPPHDPERCVICPWCRRSSAVGEVQIIGVYAHDSCARRISDRSRDPLNVYEDLTAVVSAVLIGGVVMMLLVAPAIRWMLEVRG